MRKGYSICIYVFSLFWHLAQSGVQTAVSATSARYGHEIKKRDFSLKTLRSEVMAYVRRLLTSSSSGVRFRDPSAVLLTKLGSTLLRKPIATVSLHRQRTSRRQRTSDLHRLVNGDVCGSRIFI